MKKEFDESKVKRDKIGRFATNGAKEYRQNTDYGELSNEESKKISKTKTKDEFFGVEYTGVKGRDAIEKLLKEKQGHVKAAFHRKEIGDIDLVWGDEKGGLAHAIKRRDIMRSMGTGMITGTEMAKKIPDIVENGKFDIDDHGRLKFEWEGYRVGIRPTFDGERLNWIVSAMEILK